MIDDVAQITAVERSLLTPHCRSLGAMRRLPELWFEYNILTEWTRLPFSVTEHEAFSVRSADSHYVASSSKGGPCPRSTNIMRMREIAFGGPPGLGPKSSESAFWFRSPLEASRVGA